MQTLCMKVPDTFLTTHMGRTVFCLPCGPAPTGAADLPSLLGRRGEQTPSRPGRQAATVSGDGTEEVALTECWLKPRERGIVINLTLQMRSLSSRKPIRLVARQSKSNSNTDF